MSGGSSSSNSQAATHRPSKSFSRKERLADHLDHCRKRPRQRIVNVWSSNAELAFNAEHLPMRLGCGSQQSLCATALMDGRTLSLQAELDKWRRGVATDGEPRVKPSLRAKIGQCDLDCGSQRCLLCETLLEIYSLSGYTLVKLNKSLVDNHKPKLNSTTPAGDSS